MGDKSSIEWTDATWNPVTGCTKVSPGCDNCYMYREYPRLAGMGVRGYAGGSPDHVRFWPTRLKVPGQWKRPRMIFVNSMSDTFHSDVVDVEIALMFSAMLTAPQHTYQVLTKRPNRVRRWWEWYKTAFIRSDIAWPANIWLGTSVESAKYLPRIERIAGIAPVTFLSAEPLLGPLIERESPGAPSLVDYITEVNWVIVGGESGPKARRMNMSWVRDIRDLCQVVDVSFHFKQWGGVRPKANGRVLDGRTWDEFPQRQEV